MGTTTPAGRVDSAGSTLSIVHQKPIFTTASKRASSYCFYRLFCISFAFCHHPLYRRSSENTNWGAMQNISQHGYPDSRYGRAASFGQYFLSKICGRIPHARKRVNWETLRRAVSSRCTRRVSWRCKLCPRWLGSRRVRKYLSDSVFQIDNLCNDLFLMYLG